MHYTSKTERRLDGKVKLLRLAGALCALFAALGIAHGIHDLNPAGGWLIPSVAGLVAATAFAVWWHVMIGGITGMVKTTAIVTVFIASIVVTVIALGASAQAIATAASGQAAMSAELAAKVDTYSRALSAAYAEATKVNAILDAAMTKAAGLRGQSEMEGTGENGNGKGCGPKCVSLKNSANSFQNTANTLNAMMTEAKDARIQGERAIGKLRDAASMSDQNLFLEGVQEIGQSISVLNAIDPRAIVASTGAVTVSKNGFDLSGETSDFEATAEKALKDRLSVEVPAYSTLSMQEAVRKQMFGAAMHGWILAGAIDVLPLMFLIIAFAMSREVWLNEKVTREKLTPEGRRQRDKDVLTGIQGDDDYNINVVPFRDAAE